MYDPLLSMTAWPLPSFVVLLLKVDVSLPLFDHKCPKVLDRVEIKGLIIDRFIYVIKCVLCYLNTTYYYTLGDG